MSFELLLVSLGISIGAVALLNTQWHQANLVTRKPSSAPDETCIFYETSWHLGVMHIFAVFLGIGMYFTNLDPPHGNETWFYFALPCFAVAAAGLVRAFERRRHHYSAKSQTIVVEGFSLFGGGFSKTYHYSEIRAGVEIERYKSRNVFYVRIRHPEFFTDISEHKTAAEAESNLSELLKSLRIPENQRNPPPSEPPLR